MRGAARRGEGGRITKRRTVTSTRSGGAPGGGARSALSRARFEALGLGERCCTRAAASSVSESVLGAASART